MSAPTINPALMAEYLAAKSARDAAQERLDRAVSAVIDATLKALWIRVESLDEAHAHLFPRAVEVCLCDPPNWDSHVATVFEDGRLETDRKAAILQGGRES